MIGLNGKRRKEFFNLIYIIPLVWYGSVMMQMQCRGPALYGKN
jgi:hypothetical protein